MQAYAGKTGSIYAAGTNQEKKKIQHKNQVYH